MERSRRFPISLDNCFFNRIQVVLGKASRNVHFAPRAGQAVSVQRSAISTAEPVAATEADAVRH
jgi:hypothetical protein